MKCSMLFYCLTMAIPAFAGQSHLAGTWEGTAQQQICGQPAATQEIMLTLLDNRAEGSDRRFDAIGELTVRAVKDGVVALRYDEKSAKAVSAAGTVRPIESNASEGTTYRIDLQAGNAWAGVGLYQTLSGTMQRPNAGCPALGDRGEVLMVTLHKR